jgi:hypothetical protein
MSVLRLVKNSGSVLSHRRYNRHGRHNLTLTASTSCQMIPAGPAACAKDAADGTHTASRMESVAA